MADETKHSILIAGHATSLSLEAPFWESLKEMAAQRHLSLAALITDLDEQRHLQASPPNLSSYLRVYVLEELKAKLSPSNSPIQF